MIILRILALLLCIFVPGWLAVSLFMDDRKTGDDHERLFLAAALGTAMIAVTAMALALSGTYSLALLLVLLGSASAVLALAARRRVAWLLRMKWKVPLLALALIVVALVLSVPPGRTVFGWSDVGVYPNIAAHVEREGGIVIENATVKEIAPERRTLLYDINDNPDFPFEANENKAYLITDFESGQVVPLFYPLWSSFLAVFASFLGLDNMFWAITAAGILAFWGLFLLARRLLGWRWGIAAIALAGLSPLFVYFSRYATSEMMNMALFVAASLGLTMYLQGGRDKGEENTTGTAAMAALLFSAGLLCRIDFLLVLGPLALYFLGKRIWSGLSVADWWFCGITLAGAAAAVAVGLIFSGPYYHSILGFTTRPAGLLLSPYGAVLVVFVLAFFLAARLRAAVHKLAHARRLWISLLWVCLIGLFLYLYIIRPGNADNLIDYGVINPIQGSSYINQTMVRWAWYFSTVGLALIFGGYGLWFSRRRSSPELPVMLIGIFMTIFYGLNMRCTPMHILVMRRLVPVILPVAALAAAYGLRSISDGLAWIMPKRTWGKMIGEAVAGAILLYLVLFAVNASIPIYGLEEGGNQLEVAGEISRSTTDNAVVLMDYHLGDLFGPPLRSFYGVENAWLMDNAILTDEDLSALLDDLRFPERPVYLLWRPAISGYHVPVLEGLTLEKAGEFTSWEESLQKSFEERPDHRVYDQEDIWLLRVIEE